MNSRSIGGKIQWMSVKIKMRHRSRVVKRWVSNRDGKNDFDVGRVFGSGPRKLPFWAWAALAGLGWGVDGRIIAADAVAAVLVNCTAGLCRARYGAA